MSDETSTSTELAPPATATDPITGEVYELATADTLQLAEALDVSAEWKRKLDEFRRDVSDEVLTRMDHDTRYSAAVGHFKIKGDGPRTGDYDGETLHTGLAKLVRAGVISDSAMEAAVEIETSYKVKKRGVNALAKLAGSKPEIAALLKDAHRDDHRPRRVTVSIDPDAA